MNRSFVPNPLDELIDLLDLEQIDQRVFRAYHPKGRTGRLYGGQIMAQALMASTRTVPEDRQPHSLHGYFLRPGDPDVPAVVRVHDLRDGRSFSTRRVEVIQHGETLFTMDVSLHVAESGYAHQETMPKLHPPDDARIPRALRNRPFIAWREEHKALKLERPHPARQHVWFKALHRIADDPLLHACLLVYESDNALLSTARLPHRGRFDRATMQVASLDHAIWLHRPARVDRWLLYVLDSPTAGGARGLTRGSIFTETGELVASTAQEGLIRPR